MTFSPVPYIDCYVCEIEVLASGNITLPTTALTLGSILLDTGGQISVASNFINFPENREYFVKANLTFLNVNDVNASANPTFVDSLNIALSYQAAGDSPSRTGASSGVWFSGVDCFMTLFSSASSRSAKICLLGASATYPMAVAYNDALSYIPNSSITILYR